MPFNSKTIADIFLDISDLNNQKVTCMKVQKLVYYAHGWHLAIINTPLINEQIEAWHFGPVIPSIFKNSNAFCSDTIIRETNTDTLDFSKWPEQEIHIDELVEKLLEKIWEVYGKLNEVSLANMSHHTGTPWEQTWHERGQNKPIIKEDLIREYFIACTQKKLGDKKDKNSVIGINDIALDFDQVSAKPDELTMQELKEYKEQIKLQSYIQDEITWRKIKDYALLWNISKCKGIIKIILEDGVDYKKVVKSASELDAIANILRNEKTVYYNLVTGSIASSWKPIIEEP